jgi:trimeric autotransporter adhesin
MTKFGLFALMLCITTPAYADSLAVIDQSGDGNVGAQTQSSDSNSAQLTQSGSLNTASQVQVRGATAQAIQSGDRNSVSQSQSGPVFSGGQNANLAYAEQVGNFGRLEQTQLAVGGSMTALQAGGQNGTMTIIQRQGPSGGVDSRGDTMHADQDGYVGRFLIQAQFGTSNSESTVVQDAGGFGGFAAAEQVNGDALSASIYQAGSFNQGQTIQRFGGSDDASVFQDGDSNLASIRQE